MIRPGRARFTLAGHAVGTGGAFGVRKTGQLYIGHEAARNLCSVNLVETGQLKTERTFESWLPPQSSAQGGT